MNPLISVIVPVYNTKERLNTCIDSIRKQTYKELEIILVDDGSTDGSEKICEEIGKQDNRIKVVHQENSGVSKARNQGIELAQGRYIMFVDSDDRIEAEMVEVMLKNIKANFLVMCGMIVERDGKAKIFCYKDTGIDSINKKDFLNLWKACLINSPCCKLYEKKIIQDKRIIFDEDLTLGEDLLFNLEYMKNIEGYCCINEPYYHYINFGTESLSNKYYPDQFYIQERLYSAIVEFCETQLNLSSEKWAELYCYYFKALLNSIDSEYKASGKKKTEKLWEYLKSKELEGIVEKLAGYSNKISFKNKIELFLIKRKWYKIDYMMRKMKLFIIKKE